MRPWHPAWLTPFQSLQLIVNGRHGEQSALLFSDFSPLTRLAATYNDKTVLKAFHDAERDLTAWCRQGKIDGYGFLTQTGSGQEIRERLATYWTSDRTFEFEAGALRGRPFISRVTLSRDDILNELGVVRAAAARQPAMPPPPQQKVDSFIAKRHRGLEAKERPTIPQDWAAARADPLVSSARRVQIELARKKVEPPGGYQPGRREVRKQTSPKSTAGEREK